MIEEAGLMVGDQGTMAKGKDAEAAWKKCSLHPLILSILPPPSLPSAIFSHIFTEITPCVRSYGSKNRPETGPFPLKARMEETTWQQAASDAWEMAGSGLVGTRWGHGELTTGSANSG